MLIGDAELGAVLAVLNDVAQCADLASFRHTVLRRLRELIPSDVAGYNEVRVADGQALVVLEPEDHWDHTRVDDFARFMHEHPVIRAHQSGEVGAAAISDFLSAADFHRLALYREVFGPLGVEDQLAFTLDVSDGTVTGIALNRSTRGFSDREKALLDAMTPNLAYARRAAIARERARGDLTAAVDSVAGMEMGVVNVDGDGRAVSWSLHVQELIGHHFGVSVGDDGELPAELRRWVRDGAGQPLTTARDGRELNIRFVPTRTGTGGVLLFHEPRGASVEALEARGLSRREAEVLGCVVDGLSNDEIGQRLDISPRTVQKHLERVFAKLGVHNRTAAVATVLGRG